MFSSANGRWADTTPLHLVGRKAPKCVVYGNGFDQITVSMPQLHYHGRSVVSRGNYPDIPESMQEKSDRSNNNTQRVFFYPVLLLLKELYLHPHMWMSVEGGDFLLRGCPAEGSVAFARMFTINLDDCGLGVLFALNWSTYQTKETSGQPAIRQAAVEKPSQGTIM